MAAEWSEQEDRCHGRRFVRDQPEKTGRGHIWTWVIFFQSVELKPHETDVACSQQFQIRDCSGQYITTVGRIYGKEDETDGA